jgi:hypothetical protein
LIVKIEQLLVLHLYKNKSLTIQGIGTIYLNPAVALPAEGEKDYLMPDNAFTFDYNLKATEDEALIAFIVEQTRKIKPLATSDLDSFAILSKQFLNIGKPLLIEGVGTIQKNQAGDYEFKQGHFITPKIDDIPKQIKEKNEGNISFESEQKPNNNRKNVLIGLAILLILVSAISIYYFLFNKKENPAAAAVTPITPTLIDTTKKDTLIVLKPDSLKVTETIKDSNTFKVVIKEYASNDLASKAFQKLTAYGHKLIILQKDSTHFQLAMPFTTPLNDTARARDSLKKFFKSNAYIIQ